MNKHVTFDPESLQYDRHRTCVMMVKTTRRCSDSNCPFNWSQTGDTPALRRHGNVKPCVPFSGLLTPCCSSHAPRGPRPALFAFPSPATTPGSQKGSEECKEAALFWTSCVFAAATLSTRAQAACAQQASSFQVENRPVRGLVKVLSVFPVF